MRYLPAEDEWIYKFAQTDNIEYLFVQFCVEGQKSGWPKRTRIAFIRRFQTLGESRKPELGGWSCGSLAEAIPIRKGLVQSWAAKGLLKTKKIGIQYRITSANFKAFALEYPRELRSVDRNNLLRLLPKKTVEMILECPERSRGIPFKVRRSDTGEVCENIREMAITSSVSRSHITHSINTGEPVHGIVFTRVNYKRKNHTLQSKKKLKQNKRG